MNKLKAAILDDLEYHFRQRLLAATHDLAQSAEIADIESREVITVVATGLLTELMRTCAACNVDEKTFLKSCSLAYRSMFHQMRESIKNER